MTDARGRPTACGRQTVGVRAPTTLAALTGAMVLVVLGACGDDDDGASLSSQAAAGQQLSRTSGCAACHGHDGEGGAGPAFAGLYGSNVALADGTTVVADDGYLTDAIRDPDATRVEGYDVEMPASDLSEAQIASIIAYIRELTIGPAK